MTEQAIPVFMQYGAMGVLALGFIVLLWLFWRSDKRAQQYADTLEKDQADRQSLISIVQQNTEANTALAQQLAGLNVNQQRTAEILASIFSRLENGRCPYVNERNAVRT